MDAFVGLCPLLFLAADEDVSVDDSVRCARIAREAVSPLSTEVSLETDLVPRCQPNRQAHAVACCVGAKGCSVDLVVWPRVWHDWVLHTEGCGGHGARPLREAVEALRLMGVFFNRLAGRRSAVL